MDDPRGLANSSCDSSLENGGKWFKLPLPQLVSSQLPFFIPRLGVQQAHNSNQGQYFKCFILFLINEVHFTVEPDCIFVVSYFQLFVTVCWSSRIHHIWSSCLSRLEMRQISFPGEQRDTEDEEGFSVNLNVTTNTNLYEHPFSKCEKRARWKYRVWKGWSNVRFVRFGAGKEARNEEDSVWIPAPVCPSSSAWARASAFHTAGQIIFSFP